MSDGAPRARPGSSEPASDQWLIDAACNAGHRLSRRERTPGTTAWRFLLNAGIADDEVLRLACVASDAEPADFARLTPAMGSLLSQATALMHRVVPLGLRKDVVLVATSNPKDVKLERVLAQAAKRRVQLQAGSPSDIIKAQAIVYGSGFGTPSTSRVVPPSNATVAAARDATPLPRLTLSASMPDAPDAAISPAAAKAPAGPASPVDRLLAAAVEDRASEVVLEPMSEGGVLVRMRIDGTLHDRFRVAEEQADALVASVRESAPQEMAASKTEQRVATLRTAEGAVVMRVRSERMHGAADGARRAARERLILTLSYARGLVGIAELGYSADEQRRLRALLGEPGGLVVVAGPTGAGKTATLYAAARELTQWGRLVSTVEESIEYPLSGVTQLRLGASRRLGLGAALHAAGGLTDDIVSSAVIADATLDATTFEECATAAVRGQLVVATLVAPDLTSAFAHLRALHPDGEPVAAALRGVVVQRLLRRLCGACATPQLEADLPTFERLLLAEIPVGTVRRPVGCEECRGTGYRGRLAIVAIVPIGPALRDAIARRAIATELMSVVHEERTPILWDSGIEHVRAGTTSLAELLDAVPPPQSRGPHEDLDAMLSEVLKGPSARRRNPPRGRAS